MSSAVLERSSRSAFATGAIPAAAQPTQGTAAAPNICVVPRCTLKFEKTKTGCKIHCKCDDAIAAATLQNLCAALSQGTCSCCCTWNGIQICNINLCCCHCTCENTKDGVCITCNSGDAKCCEMVQACCDCLECCCNSGCCCYISFGNTPCCCGTCA